MLINNSDASSHFATQVWASRWRHDPYCSWRAIKVDESTQTSSSTNTIRVWIASTVLFDAWKCFDDFCTVLLNSSSMPWSSVHRSLCLALRICNAEQSELEQATFAIAFSSSGDWVQIWRYKIYIRPQPRCHRRIVHHLSHRPTTFHPEALSFDIDKGVVVPSAPMSSF